MKILDFETLPSTNDYAKQHISELEDGVLVAAKQQTAGRGRCGRVWVSPDSGNIYASFLMKKVSDPFKATIVSSLAVLELLERCAPEADFFIKWPNDVYCGGKKICGILSECTAAKAGSFPAVIAGMGINVNLSPEALAEISQPAASLFALTGKKYNREKLLSELAESLNKYYIIYSKYIPELFALWKKKNRIIGREAELAGSDGTVRKVFVRDIADDGRLICMENGKEFLFSSGDVRLVKNPELFRKK